MNAPIRMTAPTRAGPHHDAGWHAHLRLRFAQRKRGVRLVHAEHEGPLYVQKAFYPEGSQCAHSYLLHPPGGLVTGDDLAIDIQVQEQAHALLTTPGAGRVYKAREQGGVQRQSLQLQVEPHASLEWLPLETILFPNAQARLHTRIDLAEKAKVIAWDITCFGLPANGIPFTEGGLQQTLQVWKQGRLQLNERLVIEPVNQEKPAFPTVLDSNAGLQGKPVHGLLIAGPFEVEDDCAGALLVELRERAQQAFQQTGALVSVTHIGAFLSVRYLGWCTSNAKDVFIDAWRCIRPRLVAREAHLPRIWAT